jgi:hypothetical protein
MSLSSEPKYFDFKIDPSDYMGIAHEEFKTTMLELALTKPSEYFALRRTVLSNVKRAAVQNQYMVYYLLLSNGSTISEPDDGSVAGKSSSFFTPNIPKQIINEFALKAAKTIDKISEEAIEMILPMNYKKISEDRTMQHTAGNLGFANTSSGLGSLTSGGGGPSESK